MLLAHGRFRIGPLVLLRVLVDLAARRCVRCSALLAMRLIAAEAPLKYLMLHEHAVPARAVPTQRLQQDSASACACPSRQC
jgi:hypothetical protein